MASSFRLAFGVSAKDIGINPWGGYQEYFVGLDVDLRKLPIWGNSNLAKFITSEVNIIRMPLPTIRFSSARYVVWILFLINLYLLQLKTFLN